jgi:predicted nucleic acid-binding protein
MLIVDATCLYEVVADTPNAEPIRVRLSEDQDHAAPHVVDLEVLNVVRRHEMQGRLDATAAGQAVDDLYGWPGERFAHQGLIPRAWSLRHDVRGWDAFYVALAEALDGTLLTLDTRLAQASGPLCPIEIPDGTTGGGALH